MARKPSTRKRREPAPAASTRREPAPAASNKRPTTKPGAACLERVLTRDATHFNLVAQLVEWCGCAAPLCAFEATSTTCAEAARTPVKLALTTTTEAKPLTSLVRSHASRRKLSMAAAGRRLVVIEAADGAHANIGIEATEGGLYRPQAAPPGVCIVAKGTEDALADCGVLVLDTSKLGPSSRARRVVRRLALATTAQQGSEGKNRLHRELVALAAALDEMGGRTAEALDVPLCQALDLILAVGAAAADVEDGRMTLEAVRRACAAAPRSAAASRQDRASRRSADPRAWFELARRGQAPPFAAAGDDTIEVAHPRLLAALVALKRQEELLAGPKGSYASSRWQKRSFRLPQLYAFELAGTEARGKYLDALAAVENSA